MNVMASENQLESSVLWLSSTGMFLYRKLEVKWFLHVEDTFRMAVMPSRCRSCMQAAVRALPRYRWGKISTGSVCGERKEREISVRMGRGWGN